MSRSFQKNFRRLSQSLIVIGLFVTGGAYVLATTPNPGHPWDEVGDGTFAVTGPSIARTYTFPDANATVLTSNAAVTLAQGGTSKALTADNGGIIYTDADSMEVLAGTATAGQTIRSGTSAAPSWSTARYAAAYSQGDILYALSNDVVSGLSKDTNSTRYLSNTGTSNAPAWAQIDLSNGATGSLPLTNGGLNASLTASNGGIFYSTGTAGAILSGTATANQVLLSGSSTTPAWSTATYPATAGSSGAELVSDGTNWASVDIVPDSYRAAFGIPTISTSATTSAAVSNTSYFIYTGRATMPYTSCIVRYRVTTAGVTFTWAEVGIFTGTWPGYNTGATLSRISTSSITANNTINTNYSVTLSSLTGISAGDGIWVAFGGQATTMQRYRASETDILTAGVVQSAAATRLSTASSPISTSQSTVAPPSFIVSCS